MFTVEVVYALLKKQDVRHVQVNAGTDINTAILQSGLLNDYPEIDLTVNKVGIYNQVKKLDDLLNAGDRIEIYRPLIADPKAVRLKRAEKQRQQGIIK
ncbi:MAG TPA: RnfH family protein [Oceanospirillales bacterium]|nr:RnfH family protein [Oceanospirillales bacterium]